MTMSSILFIVLTITVSSNFVRSLVVPQSAAGARAAATGPGRAATALPMGLFDGFRAGGTGRDRLDEEWEKQQEILKRRRAPKAERDAYFNKIEARREEASKKQAEMWGWQSKQYKKGEDPLDEWKKRRAAGTISDLEDQYGDPKKIGGIPLPMPSFGVGGGECIVYPFFLPSFLACGVNPCWGWVPFSLCLPGCVQLCLCVCVCCPPLAWLAPNFRFRRPPHELRV